MDADGERGVSDGSRAEDQWQTGGARRRRCARRSRAWIRLLALDRIQSMDTFLAASLAPQTFRTTLMLGLAVVGLLLGASRHRRRHGADDCRTDAGVRRAPGARLRRRRSLARRRAASAADGARGGPGRHRTRGDREPPARIDCCRKPLNSTRPSSPARWRFSRRLPSLQPRFRRRVCCGSIRSSSCAARRIANSRTSASAGRRTRHVRMIPAAFDSAHAHTCRSATPYN